MRRSGILVVARALLALPVLTAGAQGQTEWRKYECNPVLEGTPGGWDAALSPLPGGFCVLFDGSGYQLWYTGVSDTNTTEIGRATSPDGIHWKKNAASAPVLRPGAPGQWDGGAVYQPFVYLNGGSLVMLYEGGNTGETGVAISSNGVDWDKPPRGNPVLTRGSGGSWDEGEVNGVTVLPPDVTGGDFKMWYTGLSIDDGGHLRIGLAISGDGIGLFDGWRKDPGNPVFGLGPRGSWESEYVACPSVIFDGTTLHMWYSGFDLADNGRVGYATSTDPTGRAWKRYPGNPVLNLGAAGAWDSAHVDFPRVVFNEKRNLYQLWYTGDRTRDENTFAIGYAESPLARRSIALPPKPCPAGSPLTVSIREVDDGRDPKLPLHLREIVSGPIASGQVAPSHGGSARDLPRPPVTPAGIFQDGRVVGRVPFCPGGNGSVRFSDGAYALESLGEEIGNAGDSFTFAYSRIQGDFTLTAHLKTPGTPASPRPGRHGLMVRQDLSSRSRFAFIQDRWGDRDSFGDPLDATRWSRRETSGGDEVEVLEILAPADHYDWLRIERSGDMVSGSFSDDEGKPFAVLGTERWPAGAVLVGLAFSSLTSACCRGPSTIEFDEVKLELAPGAELLPPEPPPEGVEITWDLTRGDLKAGITYEVALESGDLHFTAGEEGIAVAGDDRVHLGPPACERFRRGDVDGDGAASITDPVLLLGYLFLGGEAPACPDAADADDSGVLDLSDAIYDLGWQFLGGPEPPAPGPKVCGSDPTAEEPRLGPCVYDPARC